MKKRRVTPVEREARAHMATKRLELSRQGVWLTSHKAGYQEIPIKDLDDNHLKNIYNLWERRGPPFHRDTADQLAQPIREEFHRRFPISGE